MVGFRSASLFPAKKLKAVTQGGTMEIGHPQERKTEGAGIVKGWENKRDRGRVLYIFTKNKNNVSTFPYPPTYLPLLLPSKPLKLTVAGSSVSTINL